MAPDGGPRVYWRQEIAFLKETHGKSIERVRVQYEEELGVLRITVDQHVKVRTVRVGLRACVSSLYVRVGGWKPDDL